MRQFLGELFVIACLTFVLSVVIGTCARTANAGTYIGYGVGIGHSAENGATETKVLNFGYRDDLFLGLSYQLEVGYFNDIAGNGRKSSAWAGPSLGVEVNAYPLTLRQMIGPACSLQPWPLACRCSCSSSPSRRSTGHLGEASAWSRRLSGRSAVPSRRASGSRRRFIPTEEVSMSDSRIFVVEARSYIAAVIQGESNLKKWLAEALQNVDLPMNVYVAANTYPFAIVESEDEGFENYMDLKLARKIAVGRAECRQHVTLYTIRGDFLGDPKKPGADYMGVLEHEHFGGDDAA